MQHLSLSNRLIESTVYPLINKPSTITQFTKNKSNDINTKQDLLFTDISEHLSIFHTIDQHKITNNTNKFTTKRIITKPHQQEFSHEIKQIN